MHTSTNRPILFAIVIHVGMTGGMLSCGDPNAPLDDVPVAASEQRQEMQGGTILSNDEIHRAGEVEIASSTGGCTGTIIYTSGFYQRTWVLTAAHCVCNSTTAKIRWPGESFGESGITFIPAGYPTGTNCFSNTNDIALIRFSRGYPVGSPTGLADLNEFVRPVWGQAPTYDWGTRYFGVLGAGITTGQSAPFPCESGTDDSTIRFAFARFDEVVGNGKIGKTIAWSPSGSYIRPGDSGGGWFTTTNPLTTPTISNLVNTGVVAGVTSTGSCGTGSQSADAAKTWDATNSNFLQSLMASDLTRTYGDWQRTCYQNWCMYSARQKAALLATAL